MSDILHASCVAFGHNGVLITGKSGSGKSSLALELIALGGVLVADDRTIITAQNDRLTATCPAPISGQIEVRKIGILATETQPSATIRLVVDLDQSEPDRLPPHRKITISGIELDCIFGKDTLNLAIATKLYLIGGRVA